MYVAELDRIVLKDTISKRPFASTQTCRKTAVTTRILGLVHQLCTKQIHVTKRDLFYTDVKLFEDQSQSDSVLDDMACMLGCTRSSLHGKHENVHVFVKVLLVALEIRTLSLTKCL